MLLAHFHEEEEGNHSSRHSGRLACKVKPLQETFQDQRQQWEAQPGVVKWEAVGRRCTSGLLHGSVVYWLDRQNIWHRVKKEAVGERKIIRDQKWSCLNTHFSLQPSVLNSDTPKAAAWYLKRHHSDQDFPYLTECKYHAP